METQDKYLIGISSHYHDSAACLFKNGELIFAAEEERFSGIKHDSSFPYKTIQYIFEHFKLTPDDIWAVCYYDDPELKHERVVETLKKHWYKSPIQSLKKYRESKRRVDEILRELHNVSSYVFLSEHHKSHMFYAYATSPFDKADHISVDGVGEWDTLCFTDDLDKEPVKVGTYPHSLGLFYAAITAYLGFKPNSDEYKVMGLASYGRPLYFQQLFDLLDHSGELKVNMKYFTWDMDDRMMYNKKLIKYLGIEPRLPEEPILQEHKDLAHSLQVVYEQYLLGILIGHGTKNKYLCISGGCGYNGVANSKVLEYLPYDKIWIPSAPSDSGSAIGSCIFFNYLFNGINPKITSSPFLGVEAKAIKEVRNKITFKTKRELYKYIAERIQEGDIVGWVQGKMEFGARALGNRSILANPLLTGTRDRLNMVVKKRENFRPFAPMVIKEKQHEFFDMNDDVPYMNQVVPVKKKHRDKLTEVTHIDGSARVQTVYKRNSTYKLLLEFEKLTGYPVLLNTSFNVQGQPMVLDGKVAYDTFRNTEMDLLVIDKTVYFK
jgi:carbamoyltransferase